MRIGIVCFPSYGGSGALATELGKKLAKRGHKIHFISTQVPFRLIGPWQRNIYYHHPYEIQYPLFGKESLEPLLFANKIVEIAKIENIELIHAHYALPFATVAVLAKQILKNNGYNIKIVTTLHGTDVSIFSRESPICDVLKFSLEKSDVVTAVCKYIAHSAKLNLGLSKLPRIIYNFVDIKREPESQNKELRSIFAQENEKIIMHTSNFREIKRIQDVITIFNNVNRKIRSKLLLIGDGPEQKTAQKLAAKFKIINRIHFMGVQSGINKLLSIADIFLLPSETEGFSLAALEAMSCRVPVVGSDTGGMPEMIKDGIDGFLAPVGDIKTMSEKVILLLKNPNLYQKIADKAQKKVQENFNADLIVRKYEKVYQDALANR